jgi:hypothetical protein
MDIDTLAWLTRCAAFLGVVAYVLHAHLKVERSYHSATGEWSWYLPRFLRR